MEPLGLALHISEPDSMHNNEKSVVHSTGSCTPAVWEKLAQGIRRSSRTARMGCIQYTLNYMNTLVFR